MITPVTTPLYAPKHHCCISHRLVQVSFLWKQKLELSRLDFSTSSEKTKQVIATYLDNVRTPVEKANIYGILLEKATFGGQYAEAIRLGEEALTTHFQFDFTKYSHSTMPSTQRDATHTRPHHDYPRLSLTIYRYGADADVFTEKVPS